MKKPPLDKWNGPRAVANFISSGRATAGAFATAFLALLAFAPEVSSQTTNDWVDGTSGTWSTMGNWTNAPDNTGVYQTNVLRFYGSTSYFSTNDLSTTGEAANTYLLHGLQLYNSVDGVVLSGNTLRFTNDPVNGNTPIIFQAGAGGVTISNNIDLGYELVLGGFGSGIVTNAGVISGTGQIVLHAGLATYVLQNANTFDGGFANSFGATLIGNASALGTGPVSLFGGTLASSDSTAYTLVNTTFTIGGDSTIGQASGGTGALTFNGTMDLSGATRTITVNNSSDTFAAVISNGGLTKAGGGTLILSGANTFSGVGNVNAGVLNLRNSSALGTSSGAGVTNGAALQLQNTIAIGAIPLTLNGTGIATDGALRNVSGANSYAGAITLGTASRINSDADTLTLTGGITGTGLGLTVGGSGNTTINTSGINTGAGGTLTKDGSGKLTIMVDGNYTGATLINQGVVNIRTATPATSGLGTTASGTTVASGAALELQGGFNTGSTTGEAVTLNGTGVSGAGALRNVANSNLFGGVITLASDSRINADASSTLTLNRITNGFSENLTVGGAGLVIVLNAVDTQSGSVIKDGTGLLALFGTGSFSNRLVVSNGTVLAGGSASALGLGTNSDAVTLVGGNLWLANDGGLNYARNVAVSNSTTIISDRFPTLGAGVTHTLANLTVGTGGPFTITVAAGSNVLTGTQGLTFSGGTGLNSDVTFNVTTNGLGGLTNGPGPVTLLTLSGTVTNGANNITVTGDGNMTIAGAITNILGGVISAGGITKNGTGTLILSGASNAFAGNVTINNGVLQMGSSGALGTNTGAGTTVNSGGTLNVQGVTTVEPLTLNGSGFGGQGALVNNTGTGNVNGPVTNATGAVYGGTAALNVNGVISGTGALTKVGANTLTLTGNDTYTGATVVSGGTLAVTGNGGQLTGTPSLTLNNGTALTVGANADAFWLNRIKDGSPVTFNRASLNLNGSVVAAPNTEQMGSDFVLGGGLNTFTLTPAPGREVELVTDIITRNGMSTLLVRGSNLGSNGNNTARFFVTNTAPTTIGGGGATDTKNISIVPWAVGDTSAAGSGTNFVTYTAATGFRPLNLTTEYELTPMSGQVNTRNYNVPAAGEFFTNGSASVNAVRITGGTLDLGGTNTTLTIGSGAIMLTINATIQNGTVAFGGNEGVIHLSQGAAVTGTLNSMLTGTGGLTVSSSGTASTLTLAGMNNGLSGAVTLNSSTVNFASDFNLGAAPGVATPSSIKLASGTLNASADFTLAANRGIELLPGGGALSAGAGNTLTYGGIIAGTTTNTFTKSGAGTLVLNGINTFAGPTLVTGGRLYLTNDNALGASPAAITNNLTLSTGTLVWAGPSGALTNRGIILTTSGTIDVMGGGSTLTDAVPLTGAGTLTKLGDGTLALTGMNSNSGAVFVNRGTLEVSGNVGQLNAPVALSVSSNAVLTLGSTADTALVNRINNAAVAVLNGGSLNLNGAALAPLATNTETAGTLTLGAGVSTLTLTPSAGNAVELVLTNILNRTNGIGATALVRGSNLGTNGADTSRILFVTNGVNAPPLLIGGSTNVPGNVDQVIVPFLVGDTNAAGAGSTFVTYGANGLRPLMESELSTATISGVDNSNNVTSGGEVLTASQGAALNALRITGGTINLNGGVLTNRSGALLFTGAATLTGGAYSNATEGIISLNSNAAFTATINSAILGTNNLTVSGNNPNSSLVLGGANQFSNLVLNGIKLGISSDSNLGTLPTASTNFGATNNLILAGGTLSNSASLTISANRGLTLLPGGGAFETPAGTTLSYGGIISSPGNASGIVKNGDGVLSLTGASTFTWDPLESTCRHASLSIL